MKFTRKEYAEIGNNNRVFLEDKLAENEPESLHMVMIRARNILVMTDPTSDPLAHQAAQLLLDPDLPSKWEKDKSKITTAVAYINLVRNGTQLTEEHMRAFKRDLSHNKHHSAQLMQPEEVSVEVFGESPSQRAFNRPALTVSVAGKSKSLGEHQDIAKLIKEYHSAVAKYEDYGFREKLRQVASLHPKEKAINSLVESILEHFKNPVHVKRFWDHGGKALITGLLKIEDTELSAKQASTLKASLTDLRPKLMRDAIFKQIEKKSPELQQQRSQFASPSGN